MVRGHLGIIRELTGAQVSELTFSGGAAKGTLWPQIIADVLGLPVHVPAVTESSALGAALCAGTGAGLYAGLTDLEGELRKRAATFEPRPAAVATYDERYERWRRALPADARPVRGRPAQPPVAGRGRGPARGPGSLKARFAEGEAVPDADSLTTGSLTEGDRFAAVRAAAHRALPAQGLRPGWTGACRAGWPGCSGRPPGAP